jgi:lipopolysaccharide transport system permease protein
VKENYLIINKDSIRNKSIISELFQNKTLIYSFFKRDFIASYKQTIFGPVWIFINPIITSFVFTIVFGGIAKISTEGVPSFLFYFSALNIWLFFQNNTIQISNFFFTSSTYFRKIYFPRLVVPFSYILNNSIKFIIHFLIFLQFNFLIFDFSLTFDFRSAIIIFLTYIYTLFFSLGIGLFLNSFTFKFRDINYFISYFFTVLMFLTPVAYPISAASEKIKFFLMINPMTTIIELYRFSLFGTGTFDFISIIYIIIVLILVLALGIFFFKRSEKNFIDFI